MEFCHGYVTNESTREQEKVDIKQLKKTCQESIMTREECYKEYERVGILYGESHKGILGLYKGNGKALAELQLADQDEGYCLHPGMLDSAIQSAIGVLNDGSGTCELMLPYGIGQCTIYQGTSKHMWAAVIPSEEQKTEEGIKKVHIHLYTDQGILAVRIQNMSFRTAQKRGKSQTKRDATLTFYPVWERKNIEWKKGGTRK